MFAIIAALLFVLAAFGVAITGVDIVALGLCALAIHLLVGAWPLGSFHIGRNRT
jgi:hypothetical protein